MSSVDQRGETFRTYRLMRHVYDHAKHVDRELLLEVIEGRTEACVLAYLRERYPAGLGAEAMFLIDEHGNEVLT